MVVRSKTIIVPVPIRQLIHNLMARGARDTKGSDLIAVYEAVNCLRSIVGDEVLKEYYGKDYEPIISGLTMMSELVAKCKAYYDHLNAQHFLEEQISSKMFLGFQEAYSKLFLINFRLFEVFYLLLRNTNVGNISIPNQYFRFEERAIKRFVREPFEKPSREVKEGIVLLPEEQIEESAE